MTTQQNKVAETISFELFNGMVNSIEQKLLNKATLKNEIKYHGEQVNKALYNDFKQIVNVLQSVVDEFYLGHYNIEGFVSFSLEDFDFCLDHNMGLIRNCKKLIKFAK